MYIVDISIIVSFPQNIQIKKYLLIQQKEIVSQSYRTCIMTKILTKDIIVKTEVWVCYHNEQMMW
jgi:hypothetical protein